MIIGEMSDNYMPKPSRQSPKDKAGPARGNIISLAGNNQLELRQRLDNLTGKFAIDHGELAIERFDAEEADIQVIVDAVQSLPFLANRKLVVIRGLSANKQAAEVIEQIISSAADSTDIIFYEPLTDKRTVFYKILKTKTEFEELSEIEPRGLPAWLANRAKKQGGSLSPADANYLIERVGSNQQMLASELDKLVTYEPDISRANIDLLTEKAPQSKIFDLLDAAFAGDKKKALAAYEGQRAQKVEPQQILTMIAWQLRLITLAKLVKDQTADEISRASGTGTFPVAKAQNLAGKLSQARLAEIVAEAEKIDRLGKTKSVDLDEALKSYITTL